MHFIVFLNLVLVPLFTLKIRNKIFSSGNSLKKVFSHIFATQNCSVLKSTRGGIFRCGCMHCQIRGALKLDSEHPTLSS